MDLASCCSMGSLKAVEEEMLLRSLGEEVAATRGELAKLAELAAFSEDVRRATSSTASMITDARTKLRIQCAQDRRRPASASSGELYMGTTALGSSLR